jgi:hypothetical protein
VVGGFGALGESRVTTVRRTRVRRYYAAALHNFRLPFYMLLLPKNASHSFGGQHVPPLYYTSPWRLTRGAFYKAAPLLLVITLYSDR